MARVASKIIDRWQMYDELGVLHKIAVHMQKSRFDGGTEFVVQVPALEISEHHASIDALRKVVAAKVKAARVEWRPMLHVDVSTKTRPHIGRFMGDNEERVVAVSVEINVDQVQITESAGRKRHKIGTSIRDDWPAIGHEEADKRYGYGIAHTRALIDDTPANRDALEQIVLGFERLSERLRAVMAPAAIARTLTAALVGGGMPMLPASTTPAPAPPTSTKPGRVRVTKR